MSIKEYSTTGNQSRKPCTILSERLTNWANLMASTLMLLYLLWLLSLHHYTYVLDLLHSDSLYNVSLSFCFPLLPEKFDSLHHMVMIPGQSTKLCVSCNDHVWVITCITKYCVLPSARSTSWPGSLHDMQYRAWKGQTFVEAVAKGYQNILQLPPFIVLSQWVILFVFIENIQW